MFGLSDIVHGASNLYHSAADAAHTVAGVTSDAYHGVADTASGAYHGAVNIANTASGYVTRAEQGITSGVHAAEDWVDQGSHSLAARVGNVPILGGVARGLADDVTMGTQVLGGVVGGATTMVGGIANAALHPIDTVRGVGAMVEHAGIPGVSNALHMGDDLLHGRSLSSALNRSFNPLNDEARREDGQFWGRMGSAIIDPYRASAHEGRYGEMVGRGIFDIGSLLLGAGEAGEAARGVGVAGDLGRAADVADAARAAGTVSDATRAAGTVSDATRAAGTVSDATRAAGTTADVTRAGAETAEAARTTGRTAEAGDATQAARTQGPGGPRYHSVYDDNLLVEKGRQPTRLPVGPDPVAEGAHTRLRWDQNSPARSGEGTGRVYQGREFDGGGNPVRDIDFTSPTYPSGRPRPDHLPPPHQHDWIPNDPSNPRAGYRRSSDPSPFQR